MTPLLWWSLGVLGYAGMGLFSAAMAKEMLDDDADMRMALRLAWPAFALALFTLNTVGYVRLCARWLARRVSP